MCSARIRPVSDVVVVRVTCRLSNIDRGLLEAEHVDSTAEIGNAYRIFMGKLRDVCPLGRSKRCDDDIGK